ncbi:fructosamine kinase family protein [Candidatus Halobonum tyrrellensis]|uniref:Fructosamine-3-kinase n=1 Tax=Candidatus Halobonum tyrrellensis G22 TaxID=1324957 RepID=V4HH49_9EURY|nr:fructosamine kinase family protein [Candidatus Halobonum tyrrellensis]ESP87179.1 fructosamine-3-kinase [Candidatus Halobonum tyrrellensis G22]
MDTETDGRVGPAVGRALDADVTGVATLDGGMVGGVHRVDLADGRTVAAKTGATPLTVEARMLDYLGDRGLAVPDVVYASDALLVLEFVAGDGAGKASGGLAPGAARDAARRLAALHDHTAERYGFPFDTLSGAYHQPNPRTDSWVDFFREHRLRHVARAARDEGTLPPGLFDRVAALCSRLGDHIPDDPPASLLHGDVWANNLMVDGGEVAAFLDPACSYGHAEVDLAYCSFVGFDRSFFEAYDRERGVEPGFRDGRCAVYRLLPELEHVRHFDADRYRRAVDATLSAVGY